LEGGDVIWNTIEGRQRWAVTSIAHGLLKKDVRQKDLPLFAVSNPHSVLPLEQKYVCSFVICNNLAFSTLIGEMEPLVGFPSWSDHILMVLSRSPILLSMTQYDDIVVFEGRETR